MTDNIKFPPMPKAHTVVKPKNSEPFGLITTRDALNFAAEAVRLNAQAVPAAQQPLTDERLRQMHHEDEFGLFCDYDDFEQIARAIEQAHGIGFKND